MCGNSTAARLLQQSLQNIGPVNTTNPRGTSEIFLKILPMPNRSLVKTLEGIVRKTAAEPRFCIKAFTRKQTRLEFQSKSRFPETLRNLSAAYHS